MITGGTSSCTLQSPSATDPFPGPAAKNKGAGYPNDVRVTCTIQLADFGVSLSDLELINTCSYPSQQPNSDPSDCVLIPRDATLKIVKDAGTDDSTVFSFDVRVNTSGSNTQVSKTITGSGNTTVPIIGGKPNSVEEVSIPTGWALDSASLHRWHQQRNEDRREDRRDRGGYRHDGHVHVQGRDPVHDANAEHDA